MVDHRSRADGVPRWVKVQGVFLILLIVVVIGMSTGTIDTSLLGLQGHMPPGGGH